MATIWTPFSRVETVVPIQGPGPFDDKEWMFEPKYDGYGAVFVKHEGHGRLVSAKTGIDYNGQFKWLLSDLVDEVLAESVVLHGELVVLDSRELPDFNALHLKKGRPTLVVYDVLFLNGDDQREKPFWRRRKILESLFIDETDPQVIRIADCAREHGVHLFKVMQEYDLEGIVAKRRMDPYRPGEVEWIKILNSDYSHKRGRQKLFRKKER